MPTEFLQQKKYEIVNNSVDEFLILNIQIVIPIGYLIISKIYRKDIFDQVLYLFCSFYQRK